MTLLLASQSSGRAAMLRAAGLDFETSAAHVDEDALTASLLAAGQTPRNIADALAEAKAVKISSRLPGVTVLGADSTLALDDGAMLSKPESPDEAADHLRRMAGTRHRLFSAAVAARDVVVLDIPLLFEKGGWRRVGAIAVVSAPAWMQRRRVMRRPGMTAAKLKAIRRLQVPDRVKRSRADFIIETGRPKSETHRQIRFIASCFHAR